VWVLEAAEGLACSALVSIKRLERGQGKRVVVRELHGTSFAEQMSLVRSLAEMEQVTAIELNVPPDSLFLHAFSEQFNISSEHELALRVLDVPEALSHLQPAADLQACVSFEVADWVVDSKQPLKVTARAQNGSVEILDSHQKDPLRCDIRTFTQLFSGGLSVSQARGMNRLDGGNAEMGAACDALLHGRMPYRSGAEAG
jgi:predicted acetyltransferase